MNNEIFLTAAYMVIWGGVFAYLLFASAQQHKLARRLRMLEEIVNEQEIKND